MNKIILRYVLNFFLFLLISFLLLGLFIKIEYKNKTGKEVFMVLGGASWVDLKEQWDTQDKLLKELKEADLNGAYNSVIASAGDEKDYISKHISANKVWGENRADVERNTDIFTALKYDKDFEDHIYKAKQAYLIGGMGPKTTDFLFEAGLNGYTDEEILQGLKKINPEYTDEETVNFINEMKGDFNRLIVNPAKKKINSYLDRQQTAKLDLLSKIGKGYEEKFKGTDTLKDLRRVDEVFNSFKGKSGRERALISSVLNTLSLEDLEALTSNRGTQGYNEFMDFLSNLGGSTNSAISAITDHSKMFAPVSSSIGNSLMKNVIKHHNEGIYKLLKENPNIYNIDSDNIVYAKDGSPTFLIKNAFDIRKAKDDIQKYKELGMMLQGMVNLNGIK